MSKKKPKPLVKSSAATAPAISLRIGDERMDAARRMLMVFAEDKSEITLRNYEKDLENFAEWMGAGDVPQAVAAFLKLSRPDAHALVLLYKGYLKKAPVYRSRTKRDKARRARAAGEPPPKPDKVGYSANTINRRLTALKSVAALARVMGLVDWRIEVKGVSTRALLDTRGCGPDGYQKLIETLEQEIEDADDRKTVAIKCRDLALVRLMHDAGLRRKEPLTADYPGDLRLRHKEKAIRVLGKKRDQREWVPMSEAAAAALRAWIKCRGRQAGPLFTSFHPSHLGKRLTPNSVNGMISRLAKRGGVAVTPHGFRHTAATTALDRGVPVRDVAKWGRWRNLQMAQTYDDNRTNPAGGIANLVSGEGDDDE